MRGFIVKRVCHVCVGNRRRWVQMPQRGTEASVPSCPLCGADTTKGDVKYDAIWRAGGKQKSKACDSKRKAEAFLTDTVKDTQEGNYVHLQPISMEELFTRWLDNSLEVRRKQGKLKPS